MLGREPLDGATAKQINPVTLAFLGDAAYSLYVRETLVCAGGGKPADFQRTASKAVSARGQSEFLERVLPLLTEEETEIFRRGRNAKKPTKSKHASPAEYNRSTGFEAVLGYLYITGKQDRLELLMRTATENALALTPAQTPYKP